ncbi:F0F1 ATP synthase subunit gamma [Methylococcus capsulatus]|uniref:ATP synthase F1, gamma subunit n=1 Tax=Methylococcus capsulatus (strain ATCC 33009 / NCIMB 11132 / Bath) TaxID=243233 RepID=Q603U1_METCA|nr:FoF1 ATP synthase subunit gamma [Methylococcus capsulatus]AAU91233.1 ATP synthase F1, gamma subunit [Methylococcus capsulatus str. Bath]QXP86803.1 F0F1 ATP synthase subunit gamma [Methylococcus capsulatus]QXP93519.1 F0F1 ATP synthase subunit gamma [Methylococcus capsulatus]UQN11777.1 F0F1 ATP synthase subunit gamma [Methylococcus capsulatus]
MSRRHVLRRRMKTLGEIAGILDSMRMLAVIESRRLTRSVECQRQLEAALRGLGRELMSHHPALTPVEPPNTAWLVVGSERGFCGDFNTRLRAALEQRRSPGEPVIVIGSRIGAELSQQTVCESQLPGPLTADETAERLPALIDAVNQLLENLGPLRIIALHHADDAEAVLETRIVPPFGKASAAPGNPFPPLLYQPPEAVFHHLVEHYLFALLHWLLDRSLLSEHQYRIRHLDGATRRIEDTLSALRSANNRLRQEEITEELQVILLGAEALDPA